MALYIKDETTAQLVTELATRCGLTKQKAVRMAVEAALQRIDKQVPLRERLARLWEAHPLPPPTGQPADKAFYDELSGEP